VPAPSPRPAFDRYTLPLPPRRERSATAVSLVMHVAIAFLVLWRGAVMVENAWAGPELPERARGGDKPATVWVVMPQLASSQPAASAPAPTPTPRRQAAAKAPAIALPSAEPIKLAVPTSPRVVLFATPTAAAIANAGSTVGDPAAGPATSTATDTSAGLGDVFGPTPSLRPTVPPGAPAGEKGSHEVRFWIRADGRVARIQVIPRIRDSEYRRRFMEAMSGFAFGPAKTRDGRPIEYVYSVVVYP